MSTLDELKVEMAKLSKQFEASEREREEAKKKTIRKAVQAELEANGCPVSNAKIGSRMLVDTMLCIVSNDRGDLVWRDDDGYELPLKKAIRTWVTQGDGYVYRNQRAVAEATEEPAQGETHQATNIDDAEAIHALREKLGQKFLDSYSPQLKHLGSKEEIDQFVEQSIEDGSILR